MHTDDFRLVTAYRSGYEDMEHTIKTQGFSCAQSMFNDYYPAGKRHTGSDLGYYYMKGEFAALFKASKTK